ncbi:MAG TPA: type II CAAX endopeptidase family protein [Longimicrobium sp.]
MTEHAEAPRRMDPFFGPHGVRTGWRVLLFAALLAVCTILFIGLIVTSGLLGDLTGGFVAMLLGGLLASAVMLRAVDRRPFGALGFALEPRAARDSAVGFGIGGGLLAGAVVLLVVAGTARWVADDGSAAEYAVSLARALAIFTVAAAAEEVMFRGYALQALVQGTGVWPAILLTSAAFAAGHANNPNVTWLGLANIFLAGIMLAVAYLRTRSLWFATALHMGWNWVMSALLDFPVSGAQFDTPLYSAREMGADWWTGGPFGPEAGLAATFAIVAGTAWMMRTPLLSASPGIRALRPLVDSHLGEAWNGR